GGGRGGLGGGQALGWGGVRARRRVRRYVGAAHRLVLDTGQGVALDLLVHGGRAEQAIPRGGRGAWCADLDTWHGVSRRRHRPPPSVLGVVAPAPCSCGRVPPGRLLLLAAAGARLHLLLGLGGGLRLRLRLRGAAGRADVAVGPDRAVGADVGQRDTEAAVAAVEQQPAALGEQLRVAVLPQLGAVVDGVQRDDVVLAEHPAT